MSSIRLEGEKLLQRHRDSVAELGHIEYDKRTHKFVVWLRDSHDAFRMNRGYVRGDEYDSMTEAKAQAAASTAARLMHLLWLSRLPCSVPSR